MARAIDLWIGKPRRSSLTDIGEYRRCCALATKDPAVFETFRRNPQYIPILENLGRELGAEAALIAFERRPDYRNLLEAFRLNDKVGAPITYSYDGIGEFSPTTLRYIKVLGDLEHLFGDMAGWKIVEIGGGFGGQCRIIKCRFPVSSYTILDLPEPGALAKKYLGTLHIDDVAINPPLAFETIEAPDLVISNYALSEIRRSVQDMYLEKIVSRARRGYMIWNEVASRKLSRTRLSKEDQPYTAEDVIQKIRGAGIVSEYPLLLNDDLARENRLIVWPQAG